MPPLAGDQAAWNAAIVPTPQLVEEFEAATIADLAPEMVTSVTLSTVNPKFGAQCVTVQSSGGFRLRYTSTQIPINLTRFQLGVWVRLDAQPPDTLVDVKFLEASGVQTTDLFLRIKSTEATLGLNDRFQWKIGSATSAAFALPVGVWRYLEIRVGLGGLGAVFAGYRYWHMATRLHGVDQFDVNFVYVAEDAGPRNVTIDYPVDPPEPGMIMGLDRWWWWAGEDTEPMPQWWSSVLGWDGTYPLASISAGLKPGYNASLVSRNDLGVI